MKIDFPVNTFEISLDDIDSVSQVLKQGLISGDTSVVRDFENKFAAYLGVENAIAVSSGSSALEIAFNISNIKPGDEVILPSFTIASCLFPILRLGAIPIFVDCNIDTWQMNVSEVIEKINNKTKAILAPHIYGLAIDMNDLIQVCSNKKILLIEDCAEALGLKFNGQYCGTYGDIAVYSFYANKLVTTGEGGMIVVKDSKCAERAKRIRNLSFNSGRRFIHNELGWNYRLSSIQSALGISQMNRIDQNLENRRLVALRYRENLANLPGIKWQNLEANGSKNVFWVNGLIFEENYHGTAEEVSVKLHNIGIDTRPFFYPLHLQPLLSNYQFQQYELPTTEFIAKQGLYLPGGNNLSISSVDEICQRILDFFVYKKDRS